MAVCLSGRLRRGVRCRRHGYRDAVVLCIGDSDVQISLNANPQWPSQLTISRTGERRFGFRLLLRQSVGALLIILRRCDFIGSRLCAIPFVAVRSSTSAFISFTRSTAGRHGWQRDIGGRKVDASTIYIGIVPGVCLYLLFVVCLRCCWRLTKICRWLFLWHLFARVFLAAAAKKKNNARWGGGGVID